MLIAPALTDATPPVSTFTVSAVISELEKRFKENQLDFEWICVLNTADRPDTKSFGALRHSPWPKLSVMSRILVSLQGGYSERWVIQVDNMVWDAALAEWRVLRLFTVQCGSDKLLARRTRDAVEDYLLQL